MSSLVKLAIGAVQVSESSGMRMHVASPWLTPLTKRVVKMVWLLAMAAKAVARPSERYAVFMTTAGARRVCSSLFLDTAGMLEFKTCMVTGQETVEGTNVTSNE